MRKSLKRIICGALAWTMVSSIAVEHVLRMDAATTNTTNTASSAKFTDVTGQFDTSALRKEYLNTQVLKDETKNYETRTVMVTLAGDTLTDYATKNGQTVSAFAKSFTGDTAMASIRKKQNAFLSKLQQTGIPYTLEDTFDTVLNAVAIEVDTKYVSRIKQISGVESAVITTAYAEPKTIKTKASEEVVNVTSVYDTGIYKSGEYASYGAGALVAVLDTGLDYTHSAFQKAPSTITWDEQAVEDIFEDLSARGVQLNAEKRSGATAKDVYVSAKVPFAYDYADDDADVYPSYSNHGTHVAGIIGGCDTSYTDKDGELIEEDFLGVVPDSQLVICKVFTDDLDDKDLGGAVAEDIVAALEDCVLLGVDVINMSLGTSCGFSTTDDGDDEGEMLNAVYENIAKAGISLVCAASNDYSSGSGGTFGTNLISNPDSSTVGSPSTFASALSVASISGQESPYFITSEGDYVFYEEARDIHSNPLNFAEGLQSKLTNGEIEYVVVSDYGRGQGYTSTVRELLKDTTRPKVALIERGENTFQEKVELAMEMGAAGVIIYNNVAGIIRMNLGEIENPIPSVSIDRDAGFALLNAAKNGVGKIKVSTENQAGPFMSDFSSWGPTHDLKIKPEITAHGGEITSTVPGGYGEQSGTSMASPNMAGVMSIVRNYVKQEHASLVQTNGSVDAVKVNRLANQLIMSTATLVRDQAGRLYSPRKQGAGLGSLEKVISQTSAYLSTDIPANLADGAYSADGRPKLELGDDKQKTGVYSMEFNVTNFGNKELTFTTQNYVLTETIAKGGLAVAEQAYTLSPESIVWKVNGETTDSVKVAAGGTQKITVEIKLSQNDKNYLDKFPNGMYVEGFLQLVSADAAQCNLGLPFLAFYGDWDSAPMLDYTAYEVAESDQTAPTEEEKIKASVWATQPFTSYYNEEYILPMGGYVYLVDENDDPVYTNEAYNAVSRYNVYYGDDSTENYLTSTAIKAVYAGLLRNARYVRYRMYDVQTGEFVYENYCNRVGKAYTAGGSGVPANVEINLSPEEMGLASGSTYRMDFEFFADALKDENGNYILDAQGNKTYPESAKESDTFSFTFTVDYEAPVLQDVRVRYYDYKNEAGEMKQRVYLDIDVYDNHYAQAIMLCYSKLKYNVETGKDEVVLQLATEYPTPVRTPNKNGTTTVEIEITDIYEKYGNQLYVQIDDYAINSCLYQIDMGKASQSLLPEGDGFTLAEGEEDITLGVYQTHKVALEYEGKANLSNFSWKSADPDIAAVKGGEIVGLKAGTTEITVSGKNGATYAKTIKVTVTEENSKRLPNASIQFGVIKDDLEALVKASGTVSVRAGEQYTLHIDKEPWYHPMTGYTVAWSSDDTKVATVSAETTSINGSITVHTRVKGTATITAKLLLDGQPTRISTSVRLRVQNPFDVSNYTLTRYDGIGYNTDDGVLVIPEDLNIMYIGEQAFKDNDTVKKIVIPSSVVDIRERAFENCTALEEVYFVSTQHREQANGTVNKDIDWADLSFIYDRAFYNCYNLKKVDFSNVKTITVGRECFENCTSLTTVVDMPSIGTMHHEAFKGCTSLVSVDLTGLHMSGNYVFENCTALESVKTGKFTAIGNYMFKNCTALYDTITLSTPKIGDGAFSGCIWLQGVKLDAAGNTDIKFDIGARAFENCGTKLGNFTFDMNNQAVRTIGKNAFIGTSLNTLEIGDNVEISSLSNGGMSLKNIAVTVATGSTKYQVEDNCVYALESGVPTKLLWVNNSASGVDGTFTLPTSVTEIGSYAFANNQNIHTVVLHDKVERIGEGAFENSALQTLQFAGAKLTEIAPRTFYGSRVTAMQLPDTVQSVGAYAFAASSVTSLQASGLLTIDHFAFENCLALQTMQLPTSVKTLGDGVFKGCLMLTEVRLPSVTEMGAYTFAESGVKKLVYGANATATGSYNFGYGARGIALTTVVFEGNIKRIEDGAFFGTANVKTVSLPQSVQSVGAFAFAYCNGLETVNGLDKVETVGDYAFYQTKLSTLTLTNAKTIGHAAFATEKQASYTSITMPNVETIGDLAFYNGAETSVALPATLRVIGDGAFASSNALASITVAENNQNFVAIDNVLYRYIGGASANEYELVCYPAARKQEADENGVKTYSIKEGTLVVQAYAFANLRKEKQNDGYGLDKVILPHSVNVIGDHAFFAAGVQEYTFESIQAPVLETLYREEVATWIENQADVNATAYYKGFYYTTFEDYFYQYTPFGGKTSTLKMNCPVNGVGYDNYVYGRYFGTAATTAVLPTDDTRALIEMLDEIDKKTPENVRAWMQADKNDQAVKAEVEAFAALVKSARDSYNNVSLDKEQEAFLSADSVANLQAVGAALRDVKIYFNISNPIVQIKMDKENSNYKAEYVVGETFDMTGLKIIVVYEDGFTEIADSAKISLQEKYQRGLKKLDKFVEVVYTEGSVQKTCRVSITVGDATEEDTSENSSSSSISTENSGLDTGIVLLIVFGSIAVLGGGGVAVYFVLRKKQQTQAAMETKEENVSQNKEQDE